MFENPRRGRQAINFTTNVPKILVLKSSSEQIFSRKLPLGSPALCADRFLAIYLHLKYQELVTQTRCCCSGLNLGDKRTYFTDQVIPPKKYHVREFRHYYISRLVL